MLNRTDLHPYQEEAVQFLTTEPAALLLMDIGAGKTVTTLTALAELDSFPALVLAPLRVAQSVWAQETRLWSHLQHLKCSRVLGTRKQRERALAADADVYLMNYENIPWLIEHDKDWAYRFESIVFDEASRMKGRGTWWKAIKRGARQIPTRIGMTGTPRGNSLIGLWSILHVLDRDDTLGRTYTSFRDKWFIAEDYEQRKWKPLPGAEEEIAATVEVMCYRMDPSDYTSLPDLIEQQIRIELPEDVMAAYTEFEESFTLDDVEAVSSAVLVNKLRQVAAGDLYNEYREVKPIHGLKMNALKDLIAELQGDPLLVFYEYKFQEAALAREIPGAVALTEDTIDDWNAGRIPVPVMYAHPAAAGHGLNLQAGGNHICFMSAPWSSELYQQAVGRLRRQGQTKPVFVHNLVAEGTIDETVLWALAGHREAEEILKELLG